MGEVRPYNRQPNLWGSGAGHGPGKRRNHPGCVEKDGHMGIPGSMERFPDLRAASGRMGQAARFS